MAEEKILLSVTLDKEQLVTALTEIKTKLAENSIVTKELKEQLKTLGEKGDTAGIQKLNEQLVLTEANTKALTTTQRQLQTQLLQTTQASTAAKGSYEQLWRTWQIAQTTLKNLEGTLKQNADGTFVLTDAFIKQSKEVNAAKEALDKFNLAVNDGRTNVGNYGKSIDPIRAELAGVRTETAALGKSLSALTSLQTGSAKLFGDQSFVATGLATAMQALVGFQELLNIKTGVKIALASADVLASESQTAAMGAETVATGALTAATETFGKAATIAWAAATAGIALLVIGVATLLEKMGQLEAAEALRARLNKEASERFEETNKAELAATIQQAQADIDRARAKKQSEQDIFELQQQLITKEIAAYRDLQAQKGFLDAADEARVEQLEKDRITLTIANDQRISEQQLADMKTLAAARVVQARIGTKEEFEARLKELKAQEVVELNAAKNNSAQQVLIRAKYVKDVKQLNVDFTKTQLEDQLALVQIQLDAQKIGTDEEFQLKLKELNLEKQAALANTQLTEAQKLQIIADSEKKQFALTDQFNKLKNDIRTLGLQAQLDATKRNSNEEYLAKVALLNSQHDAEVLAAQATITNKELLIAKLQEIDAKYAQSKTDLDNAEENRVNVIASLRLQISSQVVNSLFQVNENFLQSRIAQIQAEEDAGTISHKKAHDEIAKIKRKEADANKVQALFNIGISTTEAIMKATAQTGIYAEVPIALILALAAAQAAAVITQEVPQFAEGGLTGKRISSRDGVRINRPNGDNLLATVKTGEVILNEQQQNMLGGARVFRAIGVPGFAMGGFTDGGFGLNSVTPQPQNSDIQSVLDLIADKSPIVKVVDINNAQGNVARVESNATI